MDIELHAPPPQPASIRPRTMAGTDCAKLQVRLPAAKIKQASRKTTRRPRISLNLPLNGCVAVMAIKYADPSNEMMVTEWNSPAIVEERVDVIVLSIFLTQN